ncbi:MAG: aminomethyl-transferring glycine dehydrogenase subunit GcvPA, partial [Clostridiales bacterium]|nr:aminomethyl-transferring glycine dehydrogenase subunit GcvPA [Clostridiales bacterium]
MSQYIPNSDRDISEMLKQIGISDINELFSDISDGIKLDRDLKLPKAMAELELKRYIGAIAGRNETIENNSCFLGAGAYDHYIPSALSHIVSRAEFYTSYTPYQPEVSQGTLQAMFEYQTMICELTGMDVSNASVYDGATALAEACKMACAHTSRQTLLVSKAIHPHSRRVLNTYAKFSEIDIIEIGYEDGRISLKELKQYISKDIAAIIVQNPNFFGIIEDLKVVGELAHNNGSLFIVSVDPISLGILREPGSVGVDIVVGEGQSLGNPLNFGGPYLGFFATTKRLLRKIPGRIIGETKDADGKRGYVLTLQTREQHIRRERATSNICSNQSLNALTAAVYMALMGKEGLYDIANQCIQKSRYTYEKLLDIEGVEPVFDAPFFKEFIVKLNMDIAKLNKSLLDH